MNMSQKLVLGLGMWYNLCSPESLNFFSFSGELKVKHMKQLVETSINQCEITLSRTKINGADKFMLAEGNKSTEDDGFLEKV